MRWYELRGGMVYMLSNEEDKIFNTISKNNNKYERDNFSPREQEVARKMLSKGILNIFKKGDKVFYEINSIEEICRGL